AFPEPAQPLPGGGFAGQAQGNDTAVLDAYALADCTTRVVIGQYRAFVKAEQAVDGVQLGSCWRGFPGGADQQCRAFAPAEAETGVVEGFEQWPQRLETPLHITLDQCEELPGQFG